MLGRGRDDTRDIAIATRAVLDAHAQRHDSDIANLTRLIGEARAEGRADGERKHAENKAEIGLIREDARRFEARVSDDLLHVRSKLDGLMVKIIAGMGSLILALLAAQHWLGR